MSKKRFHGIEIVEISPNSWTLLPGMAKCTTSYVTEFRRFTSGSIPNGASVQDQQLTGNIPEQGHQLPSARASATGTYHQIER